MNRHIQSNRSEGNLSKKRTNTKICGCMFMSFDNETELGNKRMTFFRMAGEARKLKQQIMIAVTTMNDKHTTHS